MDEDDEIELTTEGYDKDATSCASLVQYVRQNVNGLKVTERDQKSLGGHPLICRGPGGGLF